MCPAKRVNKKRVAYTLATRFSFLFFDRKNHHNNGHSVMFFGSFDERKANENFSFLHFLSFFTRTSLLWVRLIFIRCLEGTDTHSVCSNSCRIIDKTNGNSDLLLVFLLTKNTEISFRKYFAHICLCLLSLGVSTMFATNFARPPQKIISILVFNCHWSQS